MKTKEPKTILAVRVTEDTKANIQRVAKLSKRRPSDVVRSILEDWMKG
jgi:uncharacterized protein (DUF1778 family)